jgi:hypothetical protein
MRSHPIECPAPSRLGGSRDTASSFSSVVSHRAVVVSGRSGKKAKPKSAMGMVIRPRMMNSYRIANQCRVKWYIRLKGGGAPPAHTQRQPARPAWPSTVL